MSKIYIFEGGSVVFEGSTLTEEEKAQAIVVCDRPQENTPEGYYPILKWDVETQTAWYEYEPIPKSEEEINQELINTLGQELAQLKIQLIIGGVI